MLRIIQHYRVLFIANQQIMDVFVKYGDIIVFKFLITLLCTIFMASCGAPSGSHEQESAAVVQNIVKLSEAQWKHAQLTNVKITQNKISATIRTNGKVVMPPQYLISVSTPMGGYLRSTKLLPGMRVNKGEVIATVEDSDLIKVQEDYLKATSRLAYLTLEYDRQKELNDGKASSDKVMQLAQAELRDIQISKAALAQQLKLLHIDPVGLTAAGITNHITIKSPMNGIVSKVNVNLGKYVSASDVLFELINPEEILLSLKVYEKDINALQMGQQVAVYAHHDRNKKYQAKVMLIGHDIDSDGTAEVLCRFDENVSKLLPGMFMTADIDINIRNVDVVPEMCIVNYEQQDFIFIQHDKYKYEMVKVELGERENGYVQLRNAEALRGRAIVQQNAYTLLMALKNAPEE